MSNSGVAHINTDRKLKQVENPQAVIADIVYFAPGSTVAGTRDGTFDYPFNTFQDAIDSFGTPTTQADYNRFCTIRCLNAPVISETLTFSTRRYIIQLNGGTFTSTGTMNIDGALRFGSSFNPQLDIFASNRPIGTQIIGNFLIQLTGTTVTNCTFRMTNILFSGNFTVADGTNGGSSVTTGTSTALTMVGSTITGTFLGRNTGVALFANSSIVGNVEWQALLGCSTGSLFSSTVSQYGTSIIPRTIVALALFNTITWTNVNVSPRWLADEFSWKQIAVNTTGVFTNAFTPINRLPALTTADATNLATELASFPLTLAVINNMRTRQGELQARLQSTNIIT